MQTFSYRKDRDLTLSWHCFSMISEAGIQSREGRRFDQHAELGAAAARKFLSRLGFPKEFRRMSDFLSATT